MSIFDPDSSVAAEFYVSLHELMSGLESRSSLTWCGIGTLQHACRNPSARAALIHTYKFTPILTRLLGAQLIHDKKLRVLQLLHELTYGVKISWQEAHLPFLITTLTQWIVGNEKELVGLSLGILVNLCYKNLPAVYTLMRSVDIKEFLRTVLKLQRDNVNTRVQVCKLLIIFEHISGEVPASDILNLVNVTFSTLGEAFRSNDVFLLRHIVDFFNDARSNPVSCDVLLTYPRFKSMAEPVFVKREPAWPSDAEEPSNFEENAVRPSDNLVEIKEDPHDAIGYVSPQEVNIGVVKELCSDEPSATVKDEIFIEEHVVNELVPYIKGENKFKSMEEPGFVKREPAWPSDAEEPSNFEENAVRLSDNQVEIKEDPHAAIADLSLQKVDIDVVKEPCSDEPSATVKDEIFIEEHVVNELVPYIKGENNVEDVGILTTGSLQTCGGLSQALLRQCNLLNQGDETPRNSSVGGDSFSQECYDKSLSLTDSGDKSYICNVCKRTFSQKFRFNEHRLSHSRPHQCNVCNKTFPRKTYLERHMLSHTREGSFSCNICNKKLKANHTLKDHMTLHSGERPFVCTVCSRNFPTKHRLTEHVARHSAEKPFVCNLCKKAFALKSGLRSHMAIHSAEKPFVCNSCKKAFALKSGLRQHMAIHSAEKQFVCKSCKKAFALKSDLRRHMAIHSAEKPFVCNSCKKAFTLKSGLRRHMVVHSAEKPFVCNSCKKAFARKSGLRQHMKVHSEDRRFDCSLCSKKFYTEDALKKHVPMHTRDGSFICS